LIRTHIMLRIPGFILSLPFLKQSGIHRCVNLTEVESILQFTSEMQSRERPRR
jgi:hypothetical protein